MLRRVWLLIGITLLAASSGADSIALDWLATNPFRDHRVHHRKSFNQWFDDDVVKRFSITGFEDLGAHLQKVTGDTESYDELNYFGAGGQTFTSLGTTTFSGRNVADLFNFEFNYSNSQYVDPAAHRISADYDHKGLKVDVGDIYASTLSGNRYLQMQREVKGLSVQYSRGPMMVKAIGSRATSSVQTVSFVGNNSPGPYYLGASQLIADSMQIQVDGRPMQLGTDFVVDAIGGSFTFTSLSVAPTSTIVVSYESVSINGAGGSITGLGAKYDFGRLGRLGISDLNQTDPTGSGLITTTDRYQGYGDQSFSYVLSYIPVPTLPVVITLDGVVQTAGIDYVFSASNPTVFNFLRFIQTTQTITATYTPETNSGARGDRNVYGFDYTLPFGLRSKFGGLTYSFARSHLDNPTTPMNGIAQGVNAQFKYRGFNLSATYDDIPPTFISVNSTSFLRNEKATTAGIQYHAHRFTFSTDGSNSAISNQATDSTGALVYQNARTTELEGGVRYAADSGFTWSVNQQHLTSWGVQGPSYADISTLSLVKAFGRLNSHIDLDRTQGFGPISNGLTTTNGSVKLTSVSWKSDYDAHGGWVLGGRVGLSAVDTDGTNAKGTDLAFNLAYYRPAKTPFRFSTDYAYSNSGEIATLGSFENGNGVGYNGNGFTNGYAGNTTDAGTGLNSAGTDVRRFDVDTSYELRHRLSLSTEYLSSAQYGAVATNALTNTYEFGATYDLHNGQTFTTSLSNSNTIYEGISENANSLSLDMTVQGHPKGPWFYNLSVGTLVSSGGTIAQNAFHYNLLVRNQFRKNQAVGFEVTSSSLTNYQPQNDIEMALSYEYRIWRNTALVLKYQIHNVTNLDPTVIGGAYQSHGFNIDLNFRF